MHKMYFNTKGNIKLLKLGKTKKASLALMVTVRTVDR